MLFRRYANPIEMLHSYHFSRVFSLLIFAIKQENEQEMWQVWLNKNIEDDWLTFKNNHSANQRQATLTAPIDEEKIMTDAFNFIQPRKDGDS